MKEYCCSSSTVVLIIVKMAFAVTDFFQLMLLCFCQECQDEAEPTSYGSNGLFLCCQSLYQTAQVL